MKNKKGAAHVGVILSFIIFIVFLTFLFSIIKPTLIKKDKESVLNYLATELVNKFSANLTSATIRIPAIYNQYDCFQINDIIDPTGLKPELKVIVKDENNAPVKSEAYSDSNNNKKYLKIDATPGKRFFKVYYSEEEFKGFPLDRTICPFTGLTYYLDSETAPIKETGLVMTQKYVFEKKIIEVLKDPTKYEELKNELKIPKANEFSFNFVYSDGTFGKQPEKEVSTEVYSKDVPVQYVDDEANIKYGFINIKVW